MEPSQPGREIPDILKVLTPAQMNLLIESLFEVRRAGGFGKVSIEFQAGTVKFIVTEIRKST